MRLNFSLQNTMYCLIHVYMFGVSFPVGGTCNFLSRTCELSLLTSGALFLFCVRLFFTISFSPLHVLPNLGNVSFCFSFCWRFSADLRLFLPLCLLSNNLTTTNETFISLWYWIVLILILDSSDQSVFHRYKPRPLLLFSPSSIAVYDIIIYHDA